MDLGRQFTRRHEDEPSRASGPAAIAPPDDAVDHGQPEGGRLARTCLSTREEIGSRQDGGNGSGLDWRGLLIAEASQW